MQNNDVSPARHRSRPGFKAGVIHGLPIGMGYLSVSFSFGVLAVSMGLTWWQAVLVSVANVTSAGQVAGIGIMAASGTIIELIVSQLVINIRYSLMAISLSQKADSSVTRLSRVFLSFMITDEIFGVAMSSDDSFGRRYYMGLMVLPFLGWSLGTLLGAVLGSILPQILIDSLSIGIYGMFIAIVVPVARANKKIAIICLIAVALSCMLYYVKIFSVIPAGFASIICAVISAAIGAFIMPVKEEVKNA